LWIKCLPKHVTVIKEKKENGRDEKQGIRRQQLLIGLKEGSRLSKLTGGTLDGTH
jgi:hypothetical protein